MAPEPRSSLVVRPGTEDDWLYVAEAMLSLQDYEHTIAGYPVYPASDALNQSYICELKELLRANDGEFLVAEYDSAPVGFLAGYVRVDGDQSVDPEFDRSAYISDIFVSEGMRNQGAGKALLAELEAAMARKGLHWLSLYVKSANQNARRAYESAGFNEYEVSMTKKIDH